jgi:predicted Zn-dependent peptidase
MLRLPRSISAATRAALPGVFATALALSPALAAKKAAPAPSKSAKPATTSAATPKHTGLESLEKQVQTFTLPNGLQFILVERHEAPVFSFRTTVNSGSANDAVGTTGLAHMMEHMAFKGTSIVGTKNYAAEKPLLDAEDVAYGKLLAEKHKGMRADTSEIKRLEKSFQQTEEASRQQVESNGYVTLIERNGGQNVNAFTSNDITAYFYSLPSNRLELWSLLEGGRMAYPVFREFYKERDVVYEERRLRYESSPTGRLFWEFITSAFVAHPYGFGGIGYPSDLKSFTREEGEEFYRRNYVAKNMCVTVVGDVKLDELKSLAQKYWSDISDAPAPPPLDTVEPEQHAERRITLEDPAQPVVFIGWHIPAGGDPTYSAYEALSSLLAGGDYARLNKVLVKEKKIAVDVSCYTGFPGEKYPNLLLLVLVPAAGQDPAAVEQEAYKVIDEIQTKKPFTQEEVDGHKVRTRANVIHTADDNSALAGELSDHQMMYGDWREFFRQADRVQSLKVADVMAAMKASMVKSNRTVAMIVSPKSAQSSEGGH